jgi:[ribosomal protein S18]-alanine N-acetyltransferase
VKLFSRKKKEYILFIQEFTPQQQPTDQEQGTIIEFLFKHLEEYGDTRQDIQKCLHYALKLSDSFGGFVLVSYEKEDPTGVVIVNKTGMNGYIPDNILVYIATHKDYRGKGIGKALMQKVLELAEGDVALHVEPENPAKFLYEKYGFSSKYLEMRWKNKS